MLWRVGANALEANVIKGSSVPTAFKNLIGWRTLLVPLELDESDTDDQFPSCQVTEDKSETSGSSYVILGRGSSPNVDLSIFHLCRPSRLVIPSIPSELKLSTDQKQHSQLLMAKSIERSDWSTAYACQAFKLGIYLSGALTVTPFQRIFEANICRTYYQEHNVAVIDLEGSVPENLCKIDAVQQQVSDINGLSSAIDLLPGTRPTVKAKPELTDDNLALAAALLYMKLQQMMSKKSTLLLNALGFLLMNLYFAGVCECIIICTPQRRAN